MMQFKLMPDVRLALAGENLPTALATALESIDLEQNADRPSQCHLQFLLDRSPSVTLQAGAALALSVGSISLFRGDIIALSTAYLPNGQQRVHVRAADALHRLEKNQPVRQFTPGALSDWVGSVLHAYELSLVDRAEPVWLHQVMQWAGSDWQQLVEACHRYGLHTFLQERTVQLFDLFHGTDTLKLTLGQNLLSATVQVLAETVCRQVTLSSWNTQTAEAWQNTLSLADLPGVTPLAELDPARFGVDGVVHLTGRTVVDAGDAATQARAFFLRRVAHSVVLQGTAEGDPMLTPGKNISLAGVAAHLCRSFVLSRCRHRIDRSSGYVTEIDSSPPPLLEVPRLASAVARVVDIDDPEGLGRIQVTYPTLNELRSNWLALLFPAAGKAKGLFLLPDVGDDVLVQFIGGDVTQAVVLGGLYGGRKPPTSNIHQGQCQQYRFITGRGQELQLDDQRDAVRLQNRDGSYLDLAPGRVTLHADADLAIEAPGKSLVIKAQAIDFEQG